MLSGDPMPEVTAVDVAALWREIAIYLEFWAVPCEPPVGLLTRRDPHRSSPTGRCVPR